MYFQQLCRLIYLLVLQVALAALPIDIPNQIVSSCSTHSDCPNSVHSKCNGGTCTSCDSNSQCDHIYSPGACFMGNCVIPCSLTNTDPCTSVRTRCFSFLGFIGNLCTECNVDTDCNALPGTAYCQLNSDINLCVNCRTNADCPSTSTCQDYKCVQCTSNTDCTDATAPYCLEQYQSNTCSGCTDNSHCSHIPGKPVCSTGTGKCVECTSSSDCKTDSTKSFCNTASNVCQMCTNDYDCPTNFPLVPVCASGVGCVQCANSTSCTNPLLSSCNSGYTCELCTASSSCSQFSTTKVCSGSALGCVECMSTSDCTDPTKSVCDTGTHTCVPCTDGTGQCSHLSSTPYCTGSQCVECLTSNNCLTVAKPVCGATNACEACTIDGQCSRFSSAPFCSTPLSRCTECLTSTTCLSPLKSNCDTGSCQLCADNTQCQHLTSTPFCIYSGCVGCVSNNDCPNTALAYCSPTVHQCQACTVDSQCTHIPSKNKCYYGECLQYLGDCPSTYTITITQQNDLSVFSVLLSVALASQIDFSQSLWIQLDGIDNADYTYSLVKLTDTTYDIDFKIQKTIPQTNLYLEVPCPAPSGILYSNISQQIEIKRIPFSTEAVAATVQTIGTVAQTLSNSLTAISGSMMFIGANPAILWALVGLFQTFYYMLFINVQYPANVEAFFPIFTMGNLNFIPNPMNIIFPDIGDYSLPVPQKFADYGVDGLFLSNAGDMLLLWFLNLAVYGFCFLLLKYARNMPRLLIFICMKSVDVFEWSGTIRTFITSFMEISVASFLQLRVLVFDSGLFVASSVCGIVFGAFSVLLPVAAFKMVEKYDTKPQLITKKFGTLIEEYRLNDGIQKYFTVINIGRNLITAATLVFLYNYPYIEIITLMTLSFSFAHLLWKYRPYESKLKNYSSFMSEFVFGSIYTCIFVLIHDDYSPSLSDNSRLMIGWCIIGGCGIILLANIAVAFAEQYSTLKEVILLIRKLIKNRSKTSAVRMKSLQIRLSKIRPIIEIHHESENFLNKSTDPSCSSTPKPPDDAETIKGERQMARLPPKLHEIENPQIQYKNKYSVIKIGPNQNLNNEDPSVIYSQEESMLESHESENNKSKAVITNVEDRFAYKSPERMRLIRRKRPFHLPIKK